MTQTIDNRPTAPVLAPEPTSMATPEVSFTIDDRPRPVHRRTEGEYYSVAGCLLASLALVWLVTYQLLAWRGKVGFVVLFFVVYIVMYAGVTALDNPRPVVIDRTIAALLIFIVLLVGAILVTTIVYIAIKGHKAFFHRNFFTQDMGGVRPTASLNHGGVSAAIDGTFTQVAIASLISLPLGIGTAVYMTEVGGRAARLVRTVVEAMTALPDILAGLFVYTVLIIKFHYPTNGLTASLALSVTMVPIIARSAEVTLRIVPGGLREASLALGATQWQTVRRVVLPTARSGLATALILGIARVVGETAPLLIVSGATTFYNANPFDGNPQTSLPLFIYSSVRSGEPAYIERGYAAALLLLVLAIVLFVIARLFARDRGSRR